MSEHIPRINPYTAEGADARNTDIIPEGDPVDSIDYGAVQPESEAKPVKKSLLKRLGGSARWLDRTRSTAPVARSGESAVDIINRLNPGQLLPMDRPAPRRESAVDMVNRVNPGMIIPERPPQGRVER